ncbi:nitroreductase, putative [Heliomicrobium modesticaldum Ice1]|uniref:Nitroreductase, putative n=1 Tax=Heliobacterium modesticaldum (strain ATCC 51547 / Ice1) TaxID=498761 RepID=B0TAM4_HELMI|nr:nitroreductase family protein [Heliomicrobium modesticaldum]ABZ83676.1 nitroreductase, putative [Heliomicrobium modesticaldum Ice1]
MELWSAIEERRSIRKYKPEEPSLAVLQKVIAAGLWAPSNMNVQPWHFVIVRGEKRAELLEVIRRSGQAILPKLERIFADKPKVIKFTLDFFQDLGKAPILIFCYGPEACAPPSGDLTLSERRVANFEYATNLQSVAAAIQNILLAAHAEGLGTCWMTGPLHVADEVNERLGISGKELVAVITLGYPDQSPPKPPRKPGRVEWLGFDVCDPAKA